MQFKISSWFFSVPRMNLIKDILSKYCFIGSFAITLPWMTTPPTQHTIIIMSFHFSNFYKFPFYLLFYFLFKTVTWLQSQNYATNYMQLSLSFMPAFLLLLAPHRFSFVLVFGLSFHYYLWRSKYVSMFIPSFLK